MGKIALLPDLLCNQIAAGEVVERPAAVVKELLENSIDAAARRITVHIRDAGRKEIRVVDDGEGMSRDDAVLAIERHATSKIRTAGDLESIHSLGFRGEALPSIAAVSRLELLTREQAATSGTRLAIDGGILRDVRDAGIPAGTQITVRDLFHNVPARRKFLRSPATEMAHITDQFLRLALASPAIHFRLGHQDRLCHDLPAVHDHHERAHGVLGHEAVAAMRPFAWEGAGLRLHGLAAPPTCQRANSQQLFLYVNRRPVWDRLLQRAVLNAYESLIPRGKFPAVVLFLELPPGAVDVNVHPTKREIRLRSPGPVLEAVRSALREVSAPSFVVPAASHFPPGRDGLQALPGGCLREQEAPLTASATAPQAIGAAFPWSVPQQRPMDSATAPWPAARPAAGAPQPTFADLPLLGQLAHTYILLEAPDGLIFIDQHAAHERLLFERLNTLLASHTPPSQRLTGPQVVEFPAREAAILERWLPQLAALGFGIDPFGGHSFLIHALPDVLLAFQPVDILKDLVAAALEDENFSPPAMLAGMARALSCRQAVKAGRPLGVDEVRQLLKDLDRGASQGTCPHGRPYWWMLSHSDIARCFQRTPGAKNPAPP
jgi:DNA mismatch repair protein MutL